MFLTWDRLEMPFFKRFSRKKDQKLNEEDDAKEETDSEHPTENTSQPSPFLRNNDHG